MGVLRVSTRVRPRGGTLLSDPDAIFVDEFGGLNKGTLTRLYYETAERVELDVLDTLCTYFKIDLPELLERVAEKAAIPAKTKQKR